MHEKKSIKGFDENELKQICKKFSFPSFHGSQIYRWIYHQKCEDFFDMKNVPENLLNEINTNYLLNTLSIKSESSSKIDETIKYLLQTCDNEYIETVSMIDKKRHTVCLSSQIGCNVDCDFCATGKMGIKRNLHTGEIIDQLILMQKKSTIPITNIVFMGMGEPFLNYSRVIKACKIFSDSKAFNLGAKRITISTSGILPKINLFIKEKHKYKLAISLNASNNKLRDSIIPINKKWNIESLLDSLKKYSYNDRTPLMFEYVLMKDFNDTNQNAKELIELLKEFNCKINLIPFNEIQSKYMRPDNDRINKFATILNNNAPNLRVLVRWSKGEDIAAACGQLATKNEN